MNGDNTVSRYRRTISLLFVAVLVLTMAACFNARSVDASPQAHPRVTVAAGDIRLDGQRWWPTGFNAYQLSTDWSVNWGCGAMVDLDAYFAALPAHSLTRFNLFQALAVNRFTGALDFGPMDRVFAAAEAHDQLVVPVLAPQDGACENDQFKDRQWYVDGWKRYTVGAERARMSFQDWMSTAVARWKDSPSLAAWELVGEPETSACTDAACHWWTRSCPADAAIVLRNFFDVAGAELREVDASTPITAGFTGGGQCGTAGDDYQFVSASPYVDIVQYHDYGADGVPLPGDQWNGLARRIDQAEAVGKPLLVAEIGESAGSCGSLDTRAKSIGTKIAGQKAAGTAGALLWAFVPDPRPGECTMDIGPDDPLHVVIEAEGEWG
ncbi:mannan endo-1,4-beta-mannosidase [Rhodococcus sp. 27YEA15]|uniref:beta-mannosidase n=1 Tax=Rhodococcus sp. 27YEA15 TaxID=3156259 RepID=UPI003C7DCCEA